MLYTNSEDQNQTVPSDDFGPCCSQMPLVFLRTLSKYQSLFSETNMKLCLLVCKFSMLKVKLYIYISNSSIHLLHKVTKSLMI